MKLILVPFTFHPDPVGGTEVYVERLATLLIRQGVDVVVAAPGEKTTTYTWQGINVRRLAVPTEISDLRELYGEGNQAAAKVFDSILAEENPDILHLHAFTRGVSLRVVRAAKARGIPVAFTYHTPTTTCQRGTMMRWGTQPCDGLMDLKTCTQCTLQGLFTGARAIRRDGATDKGVARAMTDKSARVLAHVLGSLSPAFGSWLGRRNFQGGRWTALRMTELIQLRHATVRTLFAEADYVVAVCQWVRDTLLRNGVPEHKITLCRQGAAEESEVGRPEPVSSADNSQLRIAFLGRFDPTKGVHILIKALRLLPHARLQLDIYGGAQDEAGRGYELELRRLAAGDERINFPPPMPATHVVSTLRHYDLLAVPSQLLETGPLVVLEAFAAGVPVIGSRLGGIAELVRDGIDGTLLSAWDIKNWTDAFRRLIEDPSILANLRRTLRTPRTMGDVASEMATLYRQVLVQRTELPASQVLPSVL